MAKESEEVCSLHVLPTEIFLKICSLLQVRDLVLSLSLVCKRFHEILSDDNFWKSLVAKRWNYKFPFQSIGNDLFDWKRASFELEKQWNLWKSREETVKRLNVLPNVHIAAVDAVVFVNNSVCVSASRDRSLVIWDPMKSAKKLPSYVQKSAAHDGWIWRLQCSQDCLYSCSWDNSVKIWAVDSSDLQLKSAFRCSSPVLSIAVANGTVVAGDYGKVVSAFDPRCGEEPVFKYTEHRRAVLTLGSLGTDIISGSEDKTLVVWDSRTMKVKQKMLLGKERFPNCSCINDNILYVGDSKGSVHVFNASGDSIKRLKVYNIGHQKPISVIKNGRSYLLTGSHDGTVKISLPIQPLKVLTSIKTTKGEVGGKGSLKRLGLKSGNFGLNVSFQHQSPKEFCFCPCDASSVQPVSLQSGDGLGAAPIRIVFLNFKDAKKNKSSDMDYKGGILAVGTSNYLEFWMPKEYLNGAGADGAEPEFFETGFRNLFD